MGAQPKRKITTHDQKVRRAAKKLTLGQFGTCNHCGGQVRSHHMCTACGYYKDRPVLTVS